MTIDLAQRLLTDYGIVATSLSPLDGGLDAQVHAHKAVASDGQSFFLKVSTRDVNVPALQIPSALAGAGVQGVVSPMRTIRGELFVTHDMQTIVVYPFVTGKGAGRDGLTALQWSELGTVLRAVHSFPYDESLIASVRADAFALECSALVRRWMESLDRVPVARHGAERLGALLSESRRTIVEMLGRAESAKAQLSVGSIPSVVCHADVHPWNVIIEDGGSVLLVDWEDGPKMAPKERDFIFVPAAHLDAFLAGYGESEVEMLALEYFRLERLIEDTASTCSLVFESECANKRLVDEYVSQQEQFFMDVETAGGIEFFSLA